MTHPDVHTTSGKPHWGPIAALPCLGGDHLSPATYSFDIPPFGGRAGQAEAYHVHEQAGDAQQVHGVPNEGRGDDIVDEEGPVVWQEHTPGEMQREQAAGDAPSLQGSSQEPLVPLDANMNLPPLQRGAFRPAPLTQIAQQLRRGIFCQTTSGKTHPSCGGKGARKEEQSEAATDRYAQANMWKLL